MARTSFLRSTPHGCRRADPRARTACSAPICRSPSGRGTAARVGPDDSPSPIERAQPRCALQHLLWSPDELGLARAHVVRRARHRRRHLRPARRCATSWRRTATSSMSSAPAAAWPCPVGCAASGLLGRPPAAARRGGPAARPAALPRRATRRPSPTTTTCRNDFYRLVLGPSSPTRAPTGTTDGIDARGGPGGQVRADLPQARAASRACGCSTSAAAGARWRSTPPSTTACAVVGITLSEAQAGARPRARSPRPAWPTRSRSACRTTATSTTVRSTPSARIGMFEHVGAAAACGEYLDEPARAARARRAGCSTTPSPGRPRRRRRRRSRARSWAATCSPTASCSRSARS